MRRFNFTGRIRLSRSDVHITLRRGEHGIRQFEVALNLDGLKGVSPHSAVFVEAYGGTKFERFDLGTLETPTTGRSWRLETFGPDENVLFRLKVVETEDRAGRIAAMASGIRPTEPTESPQSSLLPVTVEPLDGLVYRVDFPDNDLPRLVLSKHLNEVCDQGIKAIAKTPQFVALVYPEVVRQILTKILVIDGMTDDDDEESTPAAKWKGFARLHNPEPIPAQEDGSDGGPLLDWIDQVVSKIAEEWRISQRFQQAVREDL